MKSKEGSISCSFGFTYSTCAVSLFHSSKELDSLKGISSHCSKNTRLHICSSVIDMNDLTNLHVTVIVTCIPFS